MTDSSIAAFLRMWVRMLRPPALVFVGGLVLVGLMALPLYVAELSGFPFPLSDPRSRIAIAVVEAAWLIVLGTGAFAAVETFSSPSTDET